MIKQPLISFAIPVYNFGRFVGQTVASILDGAEVLRPEDFEILVLDSGSTDNTSFVMASLMKQHKNLRYIRTEKRGGIDHDLNSAIGLVSGVYIWFFSGDDILVPGWDRYLQPLLSDTDVALVPTVLCNFDMSERRANPIFGCYKDTDVITFEVRNNDSSIDKYLMRALSLDALFGFMSSIIVRSDFWNSLPERKDYYGSCWAHCARLIQSFQAGCSVSYLQKYLIHKRGGNDSFMEKGFVSRIEISVIGWRRLIEDFFCQSTTKSAAYALLRKDISLPLFLYGKVSAQTSAESLLLLNLARVLYCENYPTIISRLQYLIFRIFPLNSYSAPLINRALPHLIQFRHWVKKRLM